MSTKSQCQQSGLTFIPMIMEASGGGWGRQARQVWSELAKKHATATGELGSDRDSYFCLLQRLSIILHRENARAILRRQATSFNMAAAGAASSLASTLAEETPPPEGRLLLGS